MKLLKFSVASAECQTGKVCHSYNTNRMPLKRMSLQLRKVSAVGLTRELRALISLVEECKAALITKKDDLFNVDWLTETMRRFSVAHLQRELLSTVSMKNPLHVPKVSTLSHYILCCFTHGLSVEERRSTLRRQGVA